MEILHTPWRRQYVVSAREYPGCVFCDLLNEGECDEARYILHRDKRSFLLLNLFPYTPGHLMAIPYRHVATLQELEEDELSELFAMAALAERLLRRAYGCRSVHTGANLGAAAGAGVPGHLHFHTIAWPESPLWEACCNSETAPEELPTTFARLAGFLPDVLAAAEEIL